MKTAENWLKRQKQSLDVFEAMDGYAEYYHEKKEWKPRFKTEHVAARKDTEHDCHGKGYEVKGNIIYCKECGAELFEIIRHKK